MSILLKRKCDVFQDNYFAYHKAHTQRNEAPSRILRFIITITWAILTYKLRQADPSTRVLLSSLQKLVPFQQWQKFCNNRTNCGIVPNFHSSRHGIKIAKRQCVQWGKDKSTRNAGIRSVPTICPSPVPFRLLSIVSSRGNGNN